MPKDYGLSIWGMENFAINGDLAVVNYKSKPSLFEITQKLRDDGFKGPLLLRFPHLIKKQIDLLFGEFKRASKEFNYKGAFKAVFPLKVNQFPNFIDEIINISKEYNYGLEAGSKAELIIAMTKTPLGAPITVNGFKDKEMITLCFIAAKAGHNITVTIEGLNELETIIDVFKEFKDNFNTTVTPNIGMRIRMHSSGVGVWAKSGGYSSKFGLTSTELLEACDMLESIGLLDRFKMIHFHIGSQMEEIGPLKKALREAGNIYADLKKRGANSLSSINIGGGLAVEYSQVKKNENRNYSIKEFANDVIFFMQEIAKNKGVDEPDIFTESGRFIAANHSVLIAPVLELFSQEYNKKSLRLKKKNPPLIEELNDLLNSINKDNAREYMHDALDHLDSLLTLFDLGYIDLEDRSNTEILVNLIIKKSIILLNNENSDELERLESKIQEKYLVNFSIFQSLPDFWGLGQEFPIMPITNLSKKPTQAAAIWDITCDSDGEIPYNAKSPLKLHDINVDEEEYFLAFFLTGAYQEVLGMRHNLFSHPTEAVIKFKDSGEYYIDSVLESQNLKDILEDLDYDIKEIDNSLQSMIKASNLSKKEEKKALLDKLNLYLSENSYLKTIQANKALNEFN